MMASRKSQSSHKAKKRVAVRRDFLRTLLVILCLGGAGAMAMVVATTTTVVSKTEFGPEQKLRTASILFFPLFGDACRQGLFDNRNGTMSQAKTLSCEKFAKKVQQDNQSSTDRSFEKMSDNYQKLK